MTSNDKEKNADLEELIREINADPVLKLSDYTEEELLQSIEETKQIAKIARDILRILPDKESWRQVLENTVSNIVNKIEPDKIPAELLEKETVQNLVNQIRNGEIEQAKNTVLHMPAGTLLQLRRVFEPTTEPVSKEISKEITRYKNVPIEILSDFVTTQIFSKQVPSGSYLKEFEHGKKAISRLEFDLELSKTLEHVGVYESIINASVYTFMKNTNSKEIDGAQLYKIMTNDPDAKLTPRTIENILHGVNLLTPIIIKCGRVNIFDDPETPSIDVYRQIFRYEFLGIQRKPDGTPKNFKIIMSEPPLTALFAEQLHQISEKPFGFYQLPIGYRATKKNISLIYELLRLVMVKIDRPDYGDPNLDELMKKCGFDITDRDETKKARDLITAILKGREDTEKNRQNHPEIVIENYSGFEWKIDKRTGKRTNIKIKNTGIKGDATIKNTGIKGDAVGENTGIKGDATRPKRNHKKRHK